MACIDADIQANVSGLQGDLEDVVEKPQPEPEVSRKRPSKTKPPVESAAEGAPKEGPAKKRIRPTALAGDEMKTSAVSCFFCCT